MNSTATGCRSELPTNGTAFKVGVHVRNSGAVPVAPVTVFELVINLKAAKGVGLAVPAPVDITADIAREIKEWFDGKSEDLSPSLRDFIEYQLELSARSKRYAE